MNEAASSESNNNTSDPSIAWEEQRKIWLTPTSKGRGLSGKATTLNKLEKLCEPKATTKEQDSADRGITIIKNRLADGQALKEPMPLRVLVSILYKSWFLDGTITEEMVAEAAKSRSESQEKENAPS